MDVYGIYISIFIFLYIVLYSIYFQYLHVHTHHGSNQSLFRYHESSIHSMVSVFFILKLGLAHWASASLGSFLHGIVRLRKLEAEYEQEKESHEMGEVLQKKVPWTDFFQKKKASLEFQCEFWVIVFRHTFLLILKLKLNDGYRMI